jgi:hypothetical protein
MWFAQRIGHDTADRRLFFYLRPQRRFFAHGSRGRALDRPVAVGRMVER